MNNYKILICGDVDAGKSTLIRKLLALDGRDPRGYISRRMPAGEDGRSYVYLYDIAQPPERIEDSAVIKLLHEGSAEDHPEVLESLGTSILNGIPEGSLAVLDEIGTLESKATEFMTAIMRILSGRFDVLAGVKAQNTDFLRAVRAHPDCELYIVTPENRDALYEQLAEKIKS